MEAIVHYGPIIWLRLL